MIKSDHKGRFASLLGEIDAELDEIWPGWRNKKPFVSVEIDVKMRLKWLLKRRSLLLQGRDWEVRVTRSVKDPDQCFATPIMPKAVVEPGGSTTSPPGVRPHISAPHLAASCKLPLEVVEAALAALPDDVRDARAFCIEWAAQNKTKPRKPRKPRKPKVVEDPA
jgi:hypothetical protein